MLRTSLGWAQLPVGTRLERRCAGRCIVFGLRLSTRFRLQSRSIFLSISQQRVLEIETMSTCLSTMPHLVEANGKLSEVNGNSPAGPLRQLAREAAGGHGLHSVTDGSYLCIFSAAELRTPHCRYWSCSYHTTEISVAVAVVTTGAAARSHKWPRQDNTCEAGKPKGLIT